jgi:hypothetical protein
MFPVPASLHSLHVHAEIWGCIQCCQCCGEVLLFISQANHFGNNLNTTFTSSLPLCSCRTLRSHVTSVLQAMDCNHAPGWQLRLRCSRPPTCVFASVCCHLLHSCFLSPPLFLLPFCERLCCVSCALSCLLALCAVFVHVPLAGLDYGHPLSATRVHVLSFLVLYDL